MMAKRIIPCLDIKDGRTVKGTNFQDLRDAGDPIALAAMYSAVGADELVFLDISATLEKRKTVVDLVKRVGKEIDIPFAVGGGINSLSIVSEILQHGADKVCINSAAVKEPKLISEIAREFGSQCLVVAIDAKLYDGRWIVSTHGGSKFTNLDLFEWAAQCVDSGCGEILFTSMDHDGTKQGFAVTALAELSNQVSVPIIASGGAGTAEHFKTLFEQTKVTGALAASIFHYQELAIPELKTQLKSQGIEVRI